jgi:transposase-like protein
MSQENGTKPALNGQVKTAKVETEVVPKAQRRTFSQAYKKQILGEVESSHQPGQIGAILRREGLYSSHLTTWRRQLQQGEVSPQRGRPAPRESEPEVKRLRQENERLQQRLAQAEAVIDIQKKVSQLIGLNLNNDQPDESK